MKLEGLCVTMAVFTNIHQAPGLEMIDVFTRIN